MAKQLSGSGRSTELKVDIQATVETPSQILRRLRSASVFHDVGHFSRSYTITPEVLGQGTFGRVSKCRRHGSRTSSESWCAVKEITYGALKRREVSDIISEIRCLRSLNHQHIVHLKDAWIEGPTVLLVEDLLTGEDGFSAVVSAMQSKR
jgi:serine/threonine protein kinase